MYRAARILRLFALTFWVGGLAFFAFVVAPVSFAVLPTAHIAGLVVAESLAVLNPMGLVCAAVLLAGTAVLWPRSASPRLLQLELGLILAMLLGTAIVHWRVIPRMERDRIAAGGDVDAAPTSDPARLDFERLHPISEKLEGGVLLLGLAVIASVGCERAATP
jgi:putative copper export protein